MKSRQEIYERNRLPGETFEQFEARVKTFNRLHGVGFSKLIGVSDEVNERFNEESKSWPEGYPTREEK